jgi:AcrR family transcriptional regulator
MYLAILVDLYFPPMRSRRTSSTSSPPSRRASPRQVAPRPGPGRPSAARVEAINGAILVVARNEFRNAGYENVRMEAIAAAAGVSKATLYDRYATKADLLQAVVAERVAQWSKFGAPDAATPPGDMRARLRHRAHRLMEYCCSGELEQLERLFTSGPSTDELRRMRHKVGHQRTIDVIAQDLIDGVTDWQLPRDTAIRLAEMLVALLYGWWRQQQEFGRVATADGLAYANQAVEVLLDGRAAWRGLIA